ncbi:MAG TPA: type II toxin-antitoxin system RelE/ParE family toxin [Allosphingosinicella sp.]|jgi:proteic killer suppression protein
MICSFDDSETEGIWNGERSRRLPPDIQNPARRKLRAINRARKLHDLRVPRGNRLEELKGNRKGTYSIRINDQWRICFRWVDGDAHDVRIEDYHRG